MVTRVKKGFVYLLAFIMVLASLSFAKLTNVYAADAIDNSTTLADGEYTSEDFEFLWEGGTGKAHLDLDKIVVSGGKATGYFTASSANFTHAYYLGHTSGSDEDPAFYDPDTETCAEGVVPIIEKQVYFPVALNQKTEIACRTTGMGTPHWIQYYYTITIEEPSEEPEEGTLEDGTYALPHLEAGPSAMFNHFEADSKYLIIDGDNATIRFITDGSTKSIGKYSKIALGKSSELVTEDYQAELPEGTVIIEGVEQETPGTSSARYLFEITLPKSEVEQLLADEGKDDIYIIIWNKEGSSADKIPGWYKPSADIYLSLGSLGADPADITVTISDEGVVRMAQETVTVIDRNLDGKFDIDEALYAAHEQAYVGGAAAGYSSYNDPQYGLSLSKLWGNESGKFGYYVNNAMSWGLGDPVHEDDSVVAYITINAYPNTDAYSYFGSNGYQAYAKQSFTVNLQEQSGYDDNWEPVFDPATGATLKLCDTELQDIATDKYSVQEAENGNYNVTIQDAGMYYLIASDDEPVIVPAVATIKVAPEPTSVEVNFTSQAEGGFLHTPQFGCEVASNLAESYGYEDSVESGVSVLDVLVAAHELVFEDGFTVETAESLLEIGTYGSPSVQFGSDAYGGFFVNHAFANDGTMYDDDNYNGTTVSTQKVQDGDLVEFFFYEDPYYGDMYNWFLDEDENYSRTFNVEAGEDFELTLMGFYAMQGSLFKNEEEMIAFDGAQEVGDAQIYLVDLKTGACTEIEDAITDEDDGTVTLNFDEPGTYTITAYGTEDCTFTQIMSLTTINVKGPEPEKIDLAITNNTGMFKAVEAYLTKEEGKDYLVMTLSGTGYHELFRGTYEAAVENGDGTEAYGNDTWIHGYPFTYINEKGEQTTGYQFIIPVFDEEGLIPLVAISASYYTKYQQGQNVLARAFYPRQITLDREAATLVTNDFETTKTITVTNNISMFKPAAMATLHVVGGPNSNNYAATLVLPMESDALSEAFVGYPDEAEAAEETIAFDSDDMTFTIPVKWVETVGDPTTVVNLCNGKSFTISTKSASNGKWYGRTATLDEEAGTLVFDPFVDPRPAFSQHTLLLSGEIGVQFLVTFPEGFDPTGCYVEFVAKDGRTSTMQYADATQDTDAGGAWFQFDINALELADEITATLHYGDGKTLENKYSAMTYIETALDDPGYSQKGKTLVSALQTYGFYLQNSGWTDGKEHTAIAAPAQEMTADSIDAAKSELSEMANTDIIKELDGSGITDAKFTLVLNSKTVIGVYVKLDSGAKITSTGFKKTKLSGEVYYLKKTEKIGPKNLGKLYTVEAKTNVGTATVEGSAMSYVKAALNNDGFTEAKKQALAAYYYYYLAALDIQ